MYKFNYTFISNTCVASLIYKICKIDLDNMFLFSTIDDKHYYDIIVNYKTINFKQFRLYNEMQYITKLKHGMTHNIYKNTKLPNNIEFFNLPKSYCIKWFHKYKNYQSLLLDSKNPKIVAVFDNCIEMLYTHHDFNIDNLILLTKKIKKFNTDKAPYFLYELHNYSLFDYANKLLDINKNFLFINSIIDMKNTEPNLKSYIYVCKKYIIPYLIKNKIIEEV